VIIRAATNIGNIDFGATLPPEEVPVVEVVEVGLTHWEVVELELTEDVVVVVVEEGGGGGAAVGIVHCSVKL